MDTMKRYIECYIPTETCNLRCHYCYITQKRKFNAKIAQFVYSPEYIRKALSVKRLGGICLLNMCAGGETLLSKSLICVIKELLEEGHYIMIVTNGILTDRIDSIIRFPTILLKHIIFKFSFHYLELKRTGKMETFFDNIHKVRKAGCSFTLEITPNDEIIEDIEDIKNICMEKLQAHCHVTIARDDRDKRIPVLSSYPFDQFKHIWGVFDSELFNFKTEIFYKKRKEFCYAGEWSCWLNLLTGDLRQCYSGSFLQNVYKDIDTPIRFIPVGNRCKLAHCYNGHAFLSLGVIPELTTPLYSKLRNRIPIGEKPVNWLSDDMEQFLSCKLKDNNRTYNKREQFFLNGKNIIYSFPIRIKRWCLNKLDKMKNIKVLLKNDLS